MERRSKLMKALVVKQYGRTDILEFIDRDVPKPCPDQVLIKVKAASINPRDWLLMRGLYPFKRLAEPFPITLGSDMSGTVEAVGDKVRGVKIGDDVFGMQPIRGKFGAFAEYAAIRESAVAVKPTSISHAEAAAMPCAGMTSYQTLHNLAKLKPEETILINGASGGVGSYAIQMAKAQGAHVIAVCGPRNIELCKRLGADDVINYETENFEIHTAKYDIVYDVIGRSNFKKSRPALKKRGRYITTIPSLGTALSAVWSKLAALNPFGKQQTAHLVLVKPRRADLAAMVNIAVEGKLRSLIDSEYPFEQAAAAFEKSQSWRAKGKIILRISD